MTVLQKLYNYADVELAKVKPIAPKKDKKDNFGKWCVMIGGIVVSLIFFPHLTIAVLIVMGLTN